MGALVLEHGPRMLDCDFQVVAMVDEVALGYAMLSYVMLWLCCAVLCRAML